MVDTDFEIFDPSLDTNLSCLFSNATMDIYNQIHPEETPELISKSQAALEDELSKLSPDKKAGWLQAKELCPHLVDEAHTLMFLRCEVFNADVSYILLQIFVLDYCMDTNMIH